MVYNLTNVTQANTLITQVDAINSLSGQFFIMGFIFIIFIAFLFIFKKQSFKRVLLADSFFMSVLCVFLFTIGWIQFNVMIISIILLMASLIIYYFVQS